jgi:hypothetical protein
MSNTFAFKEVLNYTVQAYSATGVGGAVQFFVDYAKDSAVSTKAERLDLRGGQGNYKLLSMDHSADATFKATLPLLDTSALASMTGKALVTGATQVPKKEIITIAVAGTMTLASPPVTGSLKIYKLLNNRDISTEQTVGTPATTPEQYTISSATVTLNVTTGAIGAKFLCVYDYTSSALAKKMTITANNFPGYVRITGDALAVDESDGLTYPVKFDIKKAKVKPGFEWTFASDKATEIPFEYDLFPVTSGTDKVFFETTVLGESV